jgi:hypothetical protein
VIDTQAVESMPLNGRSFWQLTQFITSTSMAWRRPGWDGRWNGANITEFQLGGTIIQPNVDALQEFKVESANMDAQHGHTPSMINATLKSGGNQFHGDLYEFLRNSSMDARNFFYLPPPGSSLTKEPLRRNQPGASFGGPIRKDKAFFFVDFEKPATEPGC